jgi:glycosyltransferase involved in cell wall biosynthesis
MDKAGSSGYHTYEIQNRLTIIITYFNRQDQLASTLKSMESSRNKNFEVVIIDDASDENQRVDNLVKGFSFPIHLIRVKPEEKLWQEPLALVNKIVKDSKSEIVIHQSAECLHVSDVISVAIERTRSKVHLSFACLGLFDNWSLRIRRLDDLSRDKIRKALPNILFDLSCPKWHEKMEPVPGTFWNNHSVIHPSPYPWCMAMTREDYLMIGGFDEDYSNGFTCADDDFLDRVRLNNIEIQIIDDPFVIHQWHHNFFAAKSDTKELWNKNQTLLREKRAKRAMGLK